MSELLNGMVKDVAENPVTHRYSFLIPVECHDCVFPWSKVQESNLAKGLKPELW